MAAEKEQQSRHVRVTPFVVILFFLIIGIVGIMTGEVSRVLQQAVQVCLSCIGIG
ncbi:CD1871A family CXXC motif-containing protein [Thermodesulfobacteriota bacterium]